MQTFHVPLESAFLNVADLLLPVSPPKVLARTACQQSTRLRTSGAAAEVSHPVRTDHSGDAVTSTQFCDTVAVTACKKKSQPGVGWLGKTAGVV